MDLEELNIKETLSILCKTYRSIDIRAVLAKPKNESYCRWTCPFLKIRLTNENQQDLQQKHLDLADSYGLIDRKNFKVVLTAKSIQDVDLLLSDIKNGSVTLEGITSALPGSEWMQIESKKVLKDNLYSTPEEKAGFTHGVFFASMNQSLSSMITNLGLTENDCDGKLFRLKPLLDIQRNIEADINNVVIIFPIYCRKSNKIRSEDQQKKVIARYEIHNILINNSTATVIKTVYGSSESDYNKSLKLSEHIEGEPDEMITVSLPHTFKLISPDDSLKVEIRHDILGVIAEDTLDTDAILQSPYNVDSLLDTFLLLNAKDTIRPYMIGSSNDKKRGDDKRQELATSWLMTLLGFRNIYPGRFDRQDEGITGTKYTVDVLCHYSETIILAIDCTTSVPDDRDITLIKNTADHIAKKISKSVIPLIVSSENCSQNKQSSVVSIMDKNDCENICDMILKGHITQAKQFLLSVLNNPNMRYS